MPKNKGFGTPAPKRQDIHEMFRIAVDYHQRQLFTQALSAYQEILKLQPHHLDVLINIGALFKALGRIEEAIDSYEKALKINPHNPELWYNYGNTLQLQKANQEAINAYQQALKIAPQLAPAHFNLAKLFQDIENYPQAAFHYRQTIALQPNLARAYTNLGNTLKALGELDSAIDYHRQAIQLQPDYADAYYNLGNAYKAQKSYPSALVAYQQSLHLKPAFLEAKLNLASTYELSDKISEAQAILGEIIRENPDAKAAHLSLANLLKKQEKYEQAETHYLASLQLEEDSASLEGLLSLWEIQGKYEQAIAYLQTKLQKSPDNALAYFYLGSLYNEKGQFQEAIPYFKKAIELNSSLAHAYSNLGFALSQINQLESAINACEQAIKLDSSLLAALINKGYILNNQGRIQEAGECFQEVIKIDPDYYVGYSNLLYCLNYDSAQTPEQIATAHRHWGEQFETKIAPIKTYPQNRQTKKLRLGYVSADLRQHSVAYFIESVFKNHDLQAFEVFVYANVALPDALTTRLQTLVSHWRDIYKMDDDKLAAQIQTDNIDILVDLGGHTGNNRLLVFLQKPAPVQVTYLGYPNTTGTTRIDYRLTDNWADPAGLSDNYYSEKLVRLPRCFLCYQPLITAPAVSELPAQIVNKITFGSFNNLPKINPEVVAVWAEILHRLPNSRLLLKIRWFDDASTRERYLQLFAQHGIKPNQIRLIGLIPDSTHHLAFYGNIDIGLDPFPYHGTTTTCEALWMGVPVISLAGNTHVSRVGVSLLSTVGMPEFIAYSPQEYVQKAVDLANNLPRLSQLRQRLRQTVANSPLCNGIEHTKILETSYQQMWQNYIGKI